MNDKLYAQLDENGVCFCVGTPNITGIEATYDKLGQTYRDGVWTPAEIIVVPTQPTNAEIAQQLSDLQADLIIAGVI
jgi:hypothetical protein